MNKKIKTRFYVVSLLLLNLFIGLYRIDFQSIWLDEYMTLSATQDFQSMVNLFRAFPEQHPFYYLMIYFFKIGWDLKTLRLISLVAGSLSILPLYCLGKRLFSERVGLFSCLLYALSPFVLYYNQEGRMYTLLVLLTLIQVNALLIFLDRNSRAAAFAFVALSVLSMYTHFFFSLVLISEALFLLYLRKKPGIDINLKKYIIIFGVILCGYLPWFYFLMNTIGGSAQYWRGAQHIILGIPYTFFRFAVGYAIFPLNVEVKLNLMKYLPSLVTWSIILFSCYAFFAALFLRLIKKMNPAQIIVPVLTFLPILILVAVSGVKNAVSERYVIYSAPFFFITIAGVLNQALDAKKSMKVLSFALPALLSITGLFFYYGNHHFGKTDYRAASQFIQTHSRDDAVVICRPGQVVGPADYYLHKKTRILSWNLWAEAPMGDEVWVLERLTNFQVSTSLKGFGYEKLNEKIWLKENGLRLTKWQISNPKSSESPL